MEILKLSGQKWRHNNVITKSNGKIGTSEKPVKLLIIKNLSFAKFEQFCQKLCAFK